MVTCQVRAQQCEMNMLFIQDSSSSGIVPKFSGTKLGNTFTIEFWVQSLQSQKGKGIIEIGKSGDNGTLRFEIDSSFNIRSTTNFIGNTTTLTAGQVFAMDWNHVALTLSTKDTLKLYINGVLAASQKVPSRTLRISGDTLFIGKSCFLGTNIYGNIDELRIWNKERTQAQITANKDKTIADTASGLVAYYRLDDRPNSRIIHDFTGKENEGSTVGNAATTATTSPVKETKHPGYMLGVQEKVVDMGIISCGGSRQSTIHITNKGLDTLGIKSIGFIKQASIFSINTTPPFPLYPNRTGLISIQADAIGVGLFTDTLEIASSTECGGTVRVLFKIRVDSAGVEFLNPEVLLSKIPICDLPRKSSVQLKNTGGSKVTIDSYQILDDQAIEIISPILPFTIDSGATQEILFVIRDLPPSKFITRLRIHTKECSRIAEVSFAGERTDVGFILPEEMVYPAANITSGGVIYDTTFFIYNTGTSEIFINDMRIVGDPMFRIVKPISGKIYLVPGDTAEVTIRLDARTCGEFSAKLAIKGVPCGIDTSIELNAVVDGPLVEINDVYDLGSSCFTHDTTITFVNRSDITTILGKPSFDKANVFTYFDQGLLPKQLAPGDSVTIALRFNPIIPGAHTVQATLPLTPCGKVTITLKGLLGVGLIAVSDSLIDFGLACDLIPQQKSTNITNNSGKNVTVTTADIIGSLDYTLLSPLPPFALANGETKNIIVEYHPASLGLDSANLVMNDNGCFVTSIPIGGIREITSLKLVSDTIVFDMTCPTKRSVKSFGIENLGLGRVSITSATFGGTTFGIGNLANVKLGAKRVTTLPISFNPKTLGLHEDMLTIVFGPCDDTLVLHLRGIGGPIARIIQEGTLLDFGEVKVGNIKTLCVEFTNPSCLPIIIEKSSILLDGSFELDFTDSTLEHFPYTVTKDNPIRLCFRYTPTIEREDSRILTIYFATDSVTTILKGTGITPHITHTHRVLDFGDVLLDSTNTRSDTIANVGKLPVVFVNTQPISSVFTVLTSPLGLDSGDDSLLSVSFIPRAATLYEDTIFMQWEQTIDTIILRGRGTGHGALVNTTQVDFGDVRVNTSQDAVIAITAGDGFPVILSNVTIAGSSFGFSPPSTTTLSSSLDTAFVIITYSPTLEVSELVQLTFDDNAGNKKSVNLKGRGVEAHLRIDTQFVDFGVVKIGTEKTSSIPVLNTGEYPLSITEARPVTRSVFDLMKLPGNIPARSSENFEYVFTPASDIVYYDAILISADAPEKERTIILRGEGTFGDIIYSVGNVTLNVGNIVELPVSIGGTDYSSVTIDSFTCSIHYDPTVMFVHDVITENTLSSGMMMIVDRLPKDSIIRVHGFGKRLSSTPGVLFNLKVEALLGPVDTTSIVLGSSSPKHQSPQAAQGLFTVADCGKYRTNIHYKGPYSLSSPKPNPVTSTLSLSYELGLDGFVSLDIIDELGVVVKRVLAASQKRGKHNLVVNVGDLPSGMFTYILQSLEYREAKSFIILK